MALNLKDYQFRIIEIESADNLSSIPVAPGQYLIADNGDAWYDSTLTSAENPNGTRVALGKTSKEALQAQIETLQSRMTAAEGKITTAEGDINSLKGRMDTAEGKVTAIENSKGAANGLAPLDENQKVPLANMPDALIGAVVYKGVWNASTGQDGSGTAIPDASASNTGHYYVTSTPGTWNGVSFENGDWLISDGTAWSKVDTSDAVTSVAGKRGAVTLETSDIQGLDDAISASVAAFTEVTATADQTDTQALATISTKKSGDIAVVKRLITGEGVDAKYSRTAFFYDVDTWKALDGNYDAENVYFSQDLTVTSTLGRFTPDSTGSVTIPISNKNVYQALQTIGAEEKDPTITQPSVSVASPECKSYEVGTKVSPTYTVTLNAGSYQYGPATGVTATSYAVTDTKGGSKTTATGTFDELTVADGNNNYTISATVQHTAGATPLTNLKTPKPDLAIKAGSKSGNKSTITGYRNSFYGTYTSKGDNGTTSATIRTLTKSNRALSNGNTFTVDIPVGALRVVIAYPATLREVTSIKDVNGLNAEIKSGFTASTVSVEGANNYTAKDYRVYTLDYANANDKANKYTVTI